MRKEDERASGGERVRKGWRWREESRSLPSSLSCLYLQHVRLGGQAVRQVLQLGHPVRQPHRQLVVQELGGQAQLFLDGVGPKV